MTTEELWKDIKGYEGRYKISNLGRVYSYRSRKKMKTSTSSRGYIQIVLGGKCFFVHKLVARNFIPNPDNKPFINHKDGVKTNNLPSNLEWCTASENSQHSFKAGLQINPRGEEHRKTKLKNADVLKIIELSGKGLSSKDIGKKFNLSYQSVYEILTGRTWNHLTKIV
jgi:hypothetical protein